MPADRGKAPVMHFARRAITGEELRITVTGTIYRIERHNVMTLAINRVILGCHRLLSGGCGRHHFWMKMTVEFLFTGV